MERDEDDDVSIDEKEQMRTMNSRSMEKEFEPPLSMMEDKKSRDEDDDVSTDEKEQMRTMMSPHMRKSKSMEEEDRKNEFWEEESVFFYKGSKGKDRA
ncbi:hypothetical protein L6452_16996 [Arctium lappa]|uniref:Uncharacterized protein n=1 Tax=Arctium lappa TaxID=4217 RepID=A0ACB9C268_ARCLA|nr:hypothetical protein L6452_16996 [Arctium lappa]